MWGRHQLLDEVIQPHFSLLDESCKWRQRGTIYVRGDSITYDVHHSPHMMQRLQSSIRQENVTVKVVIHCWGVPKML